MNGSNSKRIKLVEDSIIKKSVNDFRHVMLRSCVRWIFSLRFLHQVSNKLKDRFMLHRCRISIYMCHSLIYFIIFHIIACIPDSFCFIKIVSFLSIKDEQAFSDFFFSYVTSLYYMSTLPICR